MGGLRYHRQRAWRQKLLMMQDVVFPFLPPFCFYFPCHKKQISLNAHFRGIFSLLAPSNTGDTTHQLAPCCKSHQSLHALPPSALTSNSLQVIFNVFCPTGGQAGLWGCSQSTQLNTPHLRGEFSRGCPAGEGQERSLLQVQSSPSWHWPSKFL